MDGNSNNSGEPSPKPSINRGSLLQPPLTLAQLAAAAEVQLNGGQSIMNVGEGGTQERPRCMSFDMRRARRSIAS